MEDRKFQKAIFSLTETHSGIFLVICIEKVLRGDDDETSECYFKPSGLKPKDKTKLETDIKEACGRTGIYRHPFAWAVIPLFDESNGELIKDLGSLEIKNLHKIKGDLISHIVEYEKVKSVWKRIYSVCCCFFV